LGGTIDFKDLGEKDKLEREGRQGLTPEELNRCVVDFARFLSGG
jgi:hypothetical protein